MLAFVPEGRSKSLSSKAEIGSIVVPLGRGYFTRDSRHFVPGYYRAFPPGQKPFPHRSASHYRETAGGRSAPSAFGARTSGKRADELKEFARNFPTVCS
jgi:hypothetical protein